MTADVSVLLAGLMDVGYMKLRRSLIQKDDSKAVMDVCGTDLVLKRYL